MDEPISDLIFNFSVDSTIDSDQLGFRIITKNYGTFFCYTIDNKLKIEDRTGHCITITPTIGSDMKNGHAFFSVDLERARRAIPEHSLVRLRLSDIEKASIDFMKKEHYYPKENGRYFFSTSAVVSNWMVSCGFLH